MHVCSACGRLSRHQKVNPEKSTLICPDCGSEDPIAFLPLFVITGGGGCGKSTVARGLRGRLPCLVVEPDYFLRIRETFDAWDGYWSYVILICRDLMKNGRPVVLPGWVNPSICEASEDIGYFSSVHYLVLSSDESTQERRLRDRGPKQLPPRPPTDELIAMALDATRILKDEANQRENATILDTTDLTPEEVLVQTESWITSRL